MANATSVPSWVDERLSKELPVLRARGESQELEFKANFPENARELAKEIAAFATSNHGIVLLGVADSGDLVGLEGVESAEERDLLIRRLGGLCSASVNPPITPSCHWAQEGDKVVLVIRVSKGNQPVYYAGKVPYLRHLTESRAVGPNEVLELVEAWLDERGRLLHRSDPEFDPELSAFMGDLAVILRDLLIYGHEVDERTINPWLDFLMAEFSGAATELRQLAVRRSAERLELSEELTVLADKADKVGHYRHVLGRESWDRFTSGVRETVDHAVSLKVEYVDTAPYPEGFVESALERLRELARLLTGVAEKAEERTQRVGIVEWLEAIGEIGRDILRVAYLGLDRFEDEVIERLRTTGHAVHLMEVRAATLVHGELNRLITEVQEASVDINVALEELERVYSAQASAESDA